MKPFSEEGQADRRLPWLKREGFRRTAALIAAPLGLYALLVVISLLGGPRIGAPLIPLPGAGADVTSPVAGQQPGQLPSRVLPPIPPDTSASASATTTTPSSAASTPLPSTPPTEELLPVGTDDLKGQPGPYPGISSSHPPRVVEQPGTSRPPATKKPPVRTSHPNPTVTTTAPKPSDPPTTPDEPENPVDPGEPEQPEPQTLGGVLHDILGLLLP